MPRDIKQMEITTPIDEFTCDICASLDGEDPRNVGFPPFHGPEDDKLGCRCAWIEGIENE